MAAERAPVDDTNSQYGLGSVSPGRLFRGWSNLVRIPSMGVSVAQTVIAAALAGAHDWILLGALALWAALYHACGFLENNLLDAAYDRRQPGKEHYPTVNGDIAIDRAWGYWSMLATAAIVVATWAILHFASTANQTFSLLFLLGSIFSGTTYNLMCKRWSGASLLLGASAGFQALFAYTVAGGTLANPLLWYVTGYEFLLIVYTIVVGAALKDLDSDPVNPLAHLGVRGGTTMPPGFDANRDPFLVTTWTWRARALCTILLLPKLILPAALVLLGSSLVEAQFVLEVVLALIVMRAYLGLTARSIRRAEFTKWFAVDGIASFGLLLVSLYPHLSMMTIALAGILPVIWFVIWNRIVWGGGRSLLAPKI